MDVSAYVSANVFLFEVPHSQKQVYSPHVQTHHRKSSAKKTELFREQQVKWKKLESPFYIFIHVLSDENVIESLVCSNVFEYLVILNRFSHDLTDKLIHTCENFLLIGSQGAADFVPTVLKRRKSKSIVRRSNFLYFILKKETCWQSHNNATSVLSLSSCRWCPPSAWRRSTWPAWCATRSAWRALAMTSAIRGRCCTTTTTCPWAPWRVNVPTTSIERPSFSGSWYAPGPLATWRGPSWTGTSSSRMLHRVQVAQSVTWTRSVIVWVTDWVEKLELNL